MLQMLIFLQTKNTMEPNRAKHADTHKEQGAMVKDTRVSVNVRTRINHNNIQIPHERCMDLWI